MKDLYSILGIDPGAGEQEVAAALESKPQLAAYAAILLDRERRAEYDRAHASLKAIGGLRHRLGLDSETSWFAENCPDFVFRQYSATAASKPADATGAVAPRQEPLAAAQAVATPEKAPARSMRPLIAILTIAAALAAAVFILR